LNESGFKYRILIVEDDASLRKFGKLLLSAQGYEVLCAEDGFEGLAALKRSLPDIIISDLRMPNMNGFEFLSVVRRRFPRIPVIVISGEYSGLCAGEHTGGCVLFQG
jgi:CheY-like chemotaxis protein